MQRDLIVKGRSLGGNSDLTLLAPIKPGLIESLEAVTYKTRIKRVLDALHTGRMSSVEYSAARLVSDSVERVGVIHSVRVAVLEPEDKVLLAVTFDGSWESYLRVLWQKVGTLLDLIFCGTIDYVTAYDHSYEQWLGWARRVQVETGFFYGPAELSAHDVLYLRRLEMLRAQRADTDRNAVRAVLPSAEERAAEVGNTRRPDPAATGAPILASATPNRIIHEQIQGGLESLAGLYRLVDLHLPDTPDGVVLHRAAHELLQEFVQLAGKTVGRKELTPALEGPQGEPNAAMRFARQLKWLFPDWPRSNASPPVVRRLPPNVLDAQPLTAQTLDDVQGGILRGYEGISHGLMLLLRFDTRAAGARLMARLETELSRESHSPVAQVGRVFRNLGLTLAGLRALGLSEDELELFPDEFRQGMAARAGALGDLRHNHPRRWRVPRRWDGTAMKPGTEPVDLGTVHAVLQLRAAALTDAQAATWSIEQPDHPLRGELRLFLDANPEITLLAVQDLRRYYSPLSTPQQPKVVEHFGFVDGIGQPVLAPASGPTTPAEERNLIHPGELLLGHDNAADAQPGADELATDQAMAQRLGWLRNGSFLVVRKYRQFVDRFDAATARAGQAMAALPGAPPVPPAQLAERAGALMMGRHRSGAPLAPAPTDRPNDFDYDADPNGTACPIHSHVRRANPRFANAGLRAPGARPPRLMRRGMSYGPRRDGAADADVERGLVFMAYNASLGEQFEVIQRWLAGGNSTGGFSGHGCPILGVPENGGVRHFRFEQPQGVVRVALEDEARPGLFDDPAPMAQLEWGLYLFAPSLSVVGRLHRLAAARTTTRVAPPWRLIEGRRLLAHLREIERTQGPDAASVAWKSTLEDAGAIDRLVSASVWAAIREDHDGLLRTPYGVLVASRELILRVLHEAPGSYSVCGQQARMKRCYGEIYLGMDDSSQYRELSGPVNEAIGRLPVDEVFAMARRSASAKLAEFEGQARRAAERGGRSVFSAGVDPREIMEAVLATVCEEWFGLSPNGGHFERGGTRWDWQPGQPPLYPGHFTALSRYMFQPNPGAKVEELGIAYGQALRQAMFAFLADPAAVQGVPVRPSDGQPAPLALAICRHPTQGGNAEFVATTMIGVLMGLIPTLTGAVLGALREWMADGSFWSLRRGFSGQEDFEAMARALHQPLAEALQMRPMPALTWRTVLRNHRFGPPGPAALDLQAGERLVLALVSGTQQSLADGQPDGRLMFGGVRAPGLSQPTHACPGYTAGVAVMVGTLAALLAYPGQTPTMAQHARRATLRPGPSALSFVIEGPTWPDRMPASGAPAVSLIQSTLHPNTAQSADEAAAITTTSFASSPSIPTIGDRTGQVVLAWGDSWVDRTVADDIVAAFAASGYALPGTATFCDWKNWGHLRDLADAAQVMNAAVADAHATSRPLKVPPGSFFELLRAQIALAALSTPSRNPLRAIVLSAGGNDCIDRTLASLLLAYQPQQPAQAPLLDPTALQALMQRLRDQYLSVIHAIRATPGAGPVPIILNGYDYPVPAGRGYDQSTLGRLWLRAAFEARGYGDGEAYDLPRARRAMRELIDAFNQMLAGVVATSGLTGLRHVDLRGLIDSHYGADGFRQAWRDDMHPTREAYRLLAYHVDAAIQSA